MPLPRTFAWPCSAALGALLFGSLTWTGVAQGAKASGKKAARGAAATGPGGFDLARLPPGKSVTIPRPATTFVSLGDKVTLTATDMPQALSFRAINRRQGQLGELELVIDDLESGGSQQVRVTPGTPFLYNFRAIGAIAVRGEALRDSASGLELQVESNKPLDIGH